MSRVVRSSKYRHVFGQTAKKEEYWDNVKPSRGAWDSNKVYGNNNYIGVIWDARGGGSFAVLPREKKGKYASDLPLVSGHKAAVLDLSFNPFNDNLIASASEDCYARVWNIPDGGLTESLTEPVQTLIGHKRKVGNCEFHPQANNVLVTTAGDYKVKLWDISTGDCKFDIPGHKEIIQSVAWNHKGDLLATTSKDKQTRVFDPRSGECISQVQAHVGVKGSRVIFLGEKEKLFTIGFGRSSDRQFSIWDPRNMSEKLTGQNVDTASGILMPFYDNDSCLLFLGGKGDGNIRYYEVVDDKPYLHFITQYKSSTPQLGMGLLPKTAVNVSVCEIDVILKACGNHIEPISFQVPRKSDIFQDDIFPPTEGGTPALSADQWFAGENKVRAKISLEGGYVAPEKPKVEFVEKKIDEGPKTEAELRKAYEELKTRVAYLEAELVKRDAKIKELSS